jgi:heme-degrading monooxygenase HmoA
MGKWPSKEKRAVALTALENKVDGFHQMRKEIWSTFNVVYFEMQEDTKIEIAPDRYYVATNFWKMDNNNEFNKYIKSWKTEVLSMNGTFVIQLTDGEAPFGYRFNPEYVSITSWKSQNEFDAFLKASQKMDTESLQNINQFRVQ